VNAWRRVLLVATALAILPGAATAQCVDGADGRCPRWVGEFTTLSANAVLAGLTAGVAQRVRGGDFAAAFVRGAVGGGVIHAGKRIAAERFTLAGLIGRETAALGASMVGNAGAGAGWFDNVALPIGPVRLEVRRGAARRLSARVDAVALGWIVWAVAERELRFSGRESMSAGAPVFLTNDRVLRFGDDGAHAAGVTNAGVIFAADVPGYGRAFRDRALAHERVHVLQQDHIALLWTDPLIDALLRRVPLAREARPFLHVNASTELLRGLGRLIPRHGERPWELEATFLARE
jgi:hypothetical protein